MNDARPRVHRVVHDPTHPQFPHHTEKGYFRGCDQPCCGQAHRREQKRRRLLAARGRSLMTPGEPVRDHVRAILAGAGAGPVAAAAALGLSTTTVTAMLTSTGEIRVTTARRYLALTVEDVRRVHRDRYTDKTRVVFLTRCLQAIGHPLQWQARQLGQATGKAPWFLTTRHPLITCGTAAKVEALAAKWGHVPGPSERSKALAARAGYHPLTAYDEDDVDEWGVPRLIPAAVFDADRTLPPAQVTARARLGVARHTILDGLPVKAAAERIGCTPRNATRHLRELRIRLRWDDVTGRTVPEPGQDWEVEAVRGAVADFDSGMDAVSAWRDLVAYLAAARSDADRDATEVAA